jgi:hypothetical protein
MSTYTHIKPWTMPRNYAGEVWPDYYSAGVGQSRDSSLLEASNFAAMLAALGGESETVIIVRESHWAVGWVEWIAIHATDEARLQIADSQMARLEDYPALDEDDWSNREHEARADYWDSLTPREKVQMAMEQRARCHWLSDVPVWRYGRLDFCGLMDDESEIGRYLDEALLQAVQ